MGVDPQLGIGAGRRTLSTTRTIERAAWLTSPRQLLAGTRRIAYVNCNSCRRHSCGRSPRGSQTLTCAALTDHESLHGQGKC